MTDAMARALQAGCQPLRFGEDSPTTVERTALDSAEEYAGPRTEHVHVHDPWMRQTCRRKGNTGPREWIRTDTYGAMRSKAYREARKASTSTDPFAAARAAERKRKKAQA